MTTTSTKRKPCVLVIDDEPTQRLLMRETLEQSGYRVVDASSGEDGVSRFAESVPDAVFLDVDMPGIDGYETCERIRRHPRGHDVPIIMTTRMDDVQSINLAYRSGATDFITKPINWTVLPHRVRYTLRAAHHAAELEKSQQRLAIAQRLARLSYWEWTPSSQGLAVSDLLRHWLGREQGQTTTLADIRGLVHPQDRDKVNDLIDAAIEGGSSYLIDHRIVLASGETRVAQHQAAVQLDTSGAPLRVTGTLLDITERVEHELALQRAKTEIEETNRLKSEFLNNISHEVRTPMNGVLGMLSLLADTPLDGEQEEFLDTATHAAQHLMKLLNDLLDFSRLEAGFEHSDPELFYIKGVFEDLERQFRPAATAKSLEFEHHIAEDLPEGVAGYAEQVHKVLAILIENAIKFTERGGITLSARCLDCSQRNVIVQFSVKDTGSGIVESALPRIFEPFTQADGSSTRRYGGTGVGLSVLKRVVEKMHGDVAVRSSPGQGSEFLVNLPLQRIA